MKNNMMRLSKVVIYLFFGLVLTGVVKADTSVSGTIDKIAVNNTFLPHPVFLVKLTVSHTNSEGCSSDYWFSVPLQSMDGKIAADLLINAKNNNASVLIHVDGCYGVHPKVYHVEEG